MATTTSSNAAWWQFEGGSILDKPFSRFRKPVKVESIGRVPSAPFIDPETLQPPITPYRRDQADRLRGPRRSSQQAGKLPPSNYGWWISHTGEAHSVPFQGHYDVARRLGHAGMSDAFDQGWIRVNPDGAEVGQLTPDALARIEGMLRANPHLLGDELGPRTLAIDSQSHSPIYVTQEDLDRGPLEFPAPRQKSSYAFNGEPFVSNAELRPDEEGDWFRSPNRSQLSEDADWWAVQFGRDAPMPWWQLAAALTPGAGNATWLGLDAARYKQGQRDVEAIHTKRPTKPAQDPRSVVHRPPRADAPYYEDDEDELEPNATTEESTGRKLAKAAANIGRGAKYVNGLGVPTTLAIFLAKKLGKYPYTAAEEYLAAQKMKEDGRAMDALKALGGMPFSDDAAWWATQLAFDDHLAKFGDHPLSTLAKLPFHVLKGMVKAGTLPLKLLWHVMTDGTKAHDPYTREGQTNAGGPSGLEDIQGGGGRKRLLGTLPPLADNRDKPRGGFGAFSRQWPAQPPAFTFDR